MNTSCHFLGQFMWKCRQITISSAFPSIKESQMSMKQKILNMFVAQPKLVTFGLS